MARQGSVYLDGKPDDFLFDLFRPHDPDDYDVTVLLQNLKAICIKHLKIDLYLSGRGSREAASRNTFEHDAGGGGS